MWNETIELFVVALDGDRVGSPKCKMEVKAVLFHQIEESFEDVGPVRFETHPESQTLKEMLVRRHDATTKDGCSRYGTASHPPRRMFSQSCPTSDHRLSN